LTKVSDVNGNPVVEYTYDSEGRRVEVTDAQGKRDVVVAPTTGGLDSPFLIVKENEVEAAFSYAGDRPLARVDEAGNPLYYLTDAMGSVIGLVDGNGQEVAEFRYDSFGNLQTPEALPSGLGGDFRFQGQWLESNTDLYHFRARYYDPETGRFVSRDPVEVIERVPGSSNPYQFVYNNPYVYSDPTGEFSIMELNTTIKVQDALRTYSQQVARDFLEEQVGRIFSGIANTVINRLLPQTFIGDIIDRAADAQTGRAGRIFEHFIQNKVCHLLPGAFSNFLWLTPQVNPQTGRVEDPGFSCDYQHSSFNPSISNPDFLFEKGDKRPFTKTDKYNRKYNPYSVLIGDIKITASNALDSMETNSSQWKAMSEHAANFQSLHFSSYITFKHARTGGSLEATLHRMRQISIRRGVHLFVAVLFE